MLNKDKRYDQEKTDCDCPFCDEPTCPVPEENDSLCGVLLSTCPACNKVVQVEVDFCPGCGEKISLKD